jgi:hypothetical protein
MTRKSDEADADGIRGGKISHEVSDARESVPLRIPQLHARGIVHQEDQVDGIEGGAESKNARDIDAGSGGLGAVLRAKNLNDEGPRAFQR